MTEKYSLNSIILIILTTTCLMLIFILLNTLKYEEIITKEVLIENNCITIYVTQDEYLKVSKLTNLIYDNKEYSYKIKEVSTTENSILYKVILETSLDKNNIITTVRFLIEKKTLWQKLIDL